VVPVTRKELANARLVPRHADEQAEYGSQPLPENLRSLDLQAVCRMGVEAAVSMAIEHLTRDGLDGFFIHFDADSLDDAIIPAVDYRLPGGLFWDDLNTTLQIALGSSKAVGIELTIYNPNLDESGAAGRELTEALAEALGTDAPVL
jgi:arginase